MPSGGIESHPEPAILADEAAAEAEADAEAEAAAAAEAAPPYTPRLRTCSVPLSCASHINEG